MKVVSNISSITTLEIESNIFIPEYKTNVKYQVIKYTKLLIFYVGSL